MLKVIFNNYAVCTIYIKKITAKFLYIYILIYLNDYFSCINIHFYRNKE